MRWAANKERRLEALSSASKDINRACFLAEEESDIKRQDILARDAVGSLAWGGFIQTDDELLDRLRDTLAAHGEPDTIYLIRKLLNEREPGSGEVRSGAGVPALASGTTDVARANEAVNRFEQSMSLIREILPLSRRREIAAQLLTEPPKLGDRGGVCLKCATAQEEKRRIWDMAEPPPRLVYALPDGADEPRWVCLSCDEGSYDL